LKILLTGASGFTGKYFAAIAREAGHQIHALESDLIDKPRLCREVAHISPDAVVHLAAISFVGQEDASLIYSVNVNGTLNLLDALIALNIPPRRVLLASSANVYGNCDASPLTEEQPPKPLNHYAISKLAMEYAAQTYAGRLPIVITRPFNYTGPGQAEHFLVPKLVSHFVRRAQVIELGNLDVEREFNDVQMVCDAYLALLEHGTPGEIYNICTGRVYKLRSLVEMLSSITGHKIDVRINPQFVRGAEVYRLSGSPAKLQKLLRHIEHTSENPPLDETLRRMLANAAASA